MKKLRQIGTSRIAITALAALLASSGAAIAASGGDDSRGDRGDRSARHGGKMGQGGPAGHGAQKYLTYSETHTYRRGAETVIRTDAGTLKAVDSDSITITRRDGVEVTTAIDEDTEIHVPGEDDATTDDLSVGKRVIISGEKGNAADMVGMPGRGGRR